MPLHEAQIHQRLPGHADNDETPVGEAQERNRWHLLAHGAFLQA